MGYPLKRCVQAASLLAALVLLTTAAAPQTGSEGLSPTLANIKKLKGPQFLHVITRKGQGYKLAEDDPIAYHGPGKFNPAEGLQKTTGGRPTYSQIFGQWLCDMAEREPRLVAITPAMRVASCRYYPLGRVKSAGTAKGSRSSRSARCSSRRWKRRRRSTRRWPTCASSSRWTSRW